MNDQFGGFDLNSFGLDSFTQGASSSTTQPHSTTHQQQQRYVSTNSNGPCTDNYNPNQVLGGAPTYNSMISHRSQHHSARTSNSGGATRNYHNHAQSYGHSQNHHQTNQAHQTLMPASVVPGGFSDFEPIPIPKREVRRVQQQQQQHQQLIASRSNSNNHTVETSTGHHRRQHHYRHQQQQQQTQTQQQIHSKRPPEAISSDFFAISHQQQHQPQPKPQPPKEEWLEKLQVKVSGVSLEPMSGTEIIKRLKLRSNEVLTRYLPCVDFLVQCQQELRKGLQVATAKRYVHHMFRDTMTSRQFYINYISNLPERFYRKNRRTMDNENITVAVKELQTLCANAKAVESQGCEVVKNTFLGGMKDGESWGLRKWLSKHGGALHICNDTECLSNSCQKLDRDLDSTKKIAERLRPLAENALKKLKSEIPSSYQEQSSAHPYLPFFHRLECALRGMANFDPEDDDVICIVDDDEVEVLKAKASAAAAAPSCKRKADADNKSKKRKKKTGGSSSTSSLKRKAPELLEPLIVQDDDGDDDDADSDIQIMERKNPAKLRQEEDVTTLHTNKTNTTDDHDDPNDNDYNLETDTGDDSDIMKELLKTLDDNDDDPINFDEFEQQGDNDDDDDDDAHVTSNINSINAFDLADGIDSVATLFDSNQHDKVRPSDIVGEEESFWDDNYRYASALRLFSEILRSSDCTSLFLESVDEDELIQEGKLPYTEIVKHPLCFRDIVSALLQDFNAADNSIECSNGMLPFGTTLSDWNMWKGMELLQAIDLVLLNSLAYGKANDGVGKSTIRSRTNKLRKVLWAGIKQVIDDHMTSADAEERRLCTPTRRGESSGFVVRKGSI
mmetsp:Transcript_39341/g.44956  ORF Transcript_39341/g.44956 Transcript_39341/m.44956 type:complete len:843 (+) Transcript_39341:127-2655(+)